MNVLGYSTYSKIITWVITSHTSKNELIKELIALDINKCAIAKMKQLELTSDSFNLYHVIEKINEDLEDEYDDPLLTKEDDETLYRALAECIDNLKLKLNWYNPIIKTIEIIEDTSIYK